MAELGNLFISLAMQTASFDKGITEANKKLNGLGKQFAGVSRQIDTHANAISGAVAKIGTAIKGLVTADAIMSVGRWAKSMGDAAESAENLASGLGVPIREFLRFQGAIELVGGDAEEAARTLTKLSVQLRAALVDPAGDAAQAFEQLGIKQEQLKANSNDLFGVLGLVADAWQKMPDGPQKTAIASELLSARFRVLVGLMRNGAQGITDLKDEFSTANKDFMSAHAAALRVDDQFDKLNLTLKNLASEGIQGLEPFLKGTIRDLQNLEAIAKAVKSALDSLFSSWGSVQGTTEDIIEQRGKEDKEIQFNRGLKSTPTRSATAADEARSTLAPVDMELPPLNVTGKKKGGGGGGGGGSAKDDAEAEAKDVAEAQRKLALTRLEHDQAMADEKFNQDKAAIQRQLDLEEVTADEAIQREKTATAEKWLADRDYYAKKFEAARGDSDQMQAIENEGLLAHQKAIERRRELDHDAAKKTFDGLREAVRDFGSVLESSFSNIFDSVIEGTFRLKNALSSLMRDFGKMLASRAFKMLMEGPSGGGGLGGLLTGALGGLFKGGSGLTLSGTSLGPAMASGGSFRVGGAGSIDSQMVAFRATPGEMVDVTRQNRVGRGGSETINIALNPSEGWVAGVADQRIVTASGQIVRVSVVESQKAVSRNFSSISGEARARQM